MKILTLKDYVEIFKDDLGDILDAKIKELYTRERELTEGLKKEREKFRHITDEVTKSFASLYTCREERELAKVVVEMDNIINARNVLTKRDNTENIEQARSYPIEGILNIETKRAGRNFVCKCPFHEDKMPSFTIYTESNSFYCFSCKRGGDSIELLMALKNISFIEAVKELS